MTRPVPAAKLNKRLKALNAKHANLETDLLTLTETPASSIVCAERIKTIKAQKCRTKIDIEQVKIALTHSSAQSASVPALQAAEPTLVEPIDWLPHADIISQFPIPANNSLAA